LRAFLAFWVAIGLWVASTAARDRVYPEVWRIAAGGDVQAALLVKVPERIGAQLLRPHTTSARSGTPATPGLVDRDALAWLPAAGEASGESLLETVARSHRPRRVSFTYEATAPPASLS
jgi:hypothetical protein